MRKVDFDYQVRVSAKARNLRLRVSAARGVEVVVPRGYDTEKVPGLLGRKAAWIHSALERVEGQRKLLLPAPAWRVPRSVSLPLTACTWHIESRQSDLESVAAKEITPDRLLLIGPVDVERKAVAGLRRWLMRKAREVLLPMLRGVSERTGLGFRRVVIKRQRTRWASCSRVKTISLNAKLLFLAPQLVEYVMVHELCHTREMTHSTDFWSLVESLCSRYQQLDSLLRDGWKNVPKWAW